jgi:hypothetical protein
MDPSELNVLLVPKLDRREDLLQQIAEEWSRTPQLRLTRRDVERRWQLESSTCSQLLDALVDRRILAQGEDGTFQAA